jgi:acyl-CoA thioesterase I
VALGDPYTIGTGLADATQAFPSLLAGKLRKATGIDVALVNLGVNGYTTADLIREELPVARNARPEIASILIGANDVVQGSDEATYRTQLAEIYDSLQRLGLAAKSVVAISTPDFSALPGAGPFGTPTDLRVRIDAFNRLAQSEAASRRFQFVDISPISRRDNNVDQWLAADGLHPGPAQHAAFADQLWDLVSPAWRRIRTTMRKG